jgi:plasmid maintenance system antidote protein VapI
MRVKNLSAIVHPGRVLLEEFLAPRGISASRLANEIGISAQRVYELGVCPRIGR